MERPVLKHIVNEKHYARAQSYKINLQDAIESIESGSIEEGIVCIDTCIKGINKYQSDIQLADSSAVGWELIERLGEDREDREKRAIECNILDERRFSKRARDE
mgnify:CR=1 FL=1